jgi:hypothetical protein
MSERTNHLDKIQHLDFNLECAAVATIYHNGRAVGTKPIEHSGPAIADVVFETLDGQRRESFMCKGCLSAAQQKDQVIYVHRIG